MRWVSSHFQQTLEVEALVLGLQWLASVALGSNLVLVTSCRYPPELGKAQRRILVPILLYRVFENVKTIRRQAVCFER